MVQIVSFTGSFSNASKHWVSTMSFGHVVDQLHDKYSLANTSSTKKTFHNQQTKLMLKEGTQRYNTIIKEKGNIKQRKHWNQSLSN